jgi:serine/threonine-protein kinase
MNRKEALRMSERVLAPGAALDGYRIDRLIGRGGMGSVYEATQLSLERPVALKVIAPEYSADASFRERFRREGRIQARIDHPHIIPIHDAGESEHGLFLAMRLVRGASLVEVLGRGTLDVIGSLHLLGQTAGALDAAHEAGLVHRDVKPQNILVELRRAEHAYLADFGITRAEGDPHLTATGSIVGTIDYMAPEQFLGRPATRASDVYSFGCVLFECLTGSVPFARETSVAVMFAHVSEEPPSACAQRPELPDEIDAVVARALAKDPAERFATATDLVAAAAAAFGETEPLAVPCPTESLRRRRQSVRRQLAHGLIAAGARLAAETR